MGDSIQHLVLVFFLTFTLSLSAVIGTNLLFQTVQGRAKQVEPIKAPETAPRTADTFRLKRTAINQSSLDEKLSMTPPANKRVTERVSEPKQSSKFNDEDIDRLLAPPESTAIHTLTRNQADEIVQAGPELLAGIISGRLAKAVKEEQSAVGVEIQLPEITALHMIGIENGDLLQSIDGVPIKSARHFVRVLLSKIKQEKLFLMLTRTGVPKHIELRLPPVLRDRTDLYR